MFGIAGATNASNAGGGGGEVPDGFPSDGLIALFYDAGTYYDDSSVEWACVNNPALKLVEDSGFAPIGVTGSNRLEFDSSDALDFNAALISAVTGIDDMTVVIGGTTDNDTDVLIEGASSYKRSVFIKTWAFRAWVGPMASGSAIISAADAPGTDVFGVGRGLFPRNGTIAVQWGSGTKITGGDLTDAATADPSTNARLFSAGDAEVGFMAIYGSILSDGDWATLLSTVSDDAAFGAEGLDLT